MTHHCFRGWPQFIDVIGDETRAALQQYASKRGVDIWRPAPETWVIYDRCEFVNPTNGPNGFSVYNSIPCDRNTTIFTWRISHFPCAAMQARRLAYLRRKCSLWSLRHFDDGAARKNTESRAARQESLESLSMFTDFARLAFAPHVIVNGAGSSWSFYSAIAAAPHVVFGSQLSGDISVLHAPPRRVFVPSAVFRLAQEMGAWLVEH